MPGPKIRTSVEVDHIAQEVKFRFSQLVDYIGMDADTALAFAKLIEDKARELKGRIVVPVNFGRG